MGRGNKYQPPSVGDFRIVKRFVICLDLPIDANQDLRGTRQTRWLEWAYVLQRSERGEFPGSPRWRDIAWATKEDYRE